MTRKMSRERAIAAAVKEVVGTTGWAKSTNLRTALETELLPALEKLGYTITDLPPDDVLDHYAQRAGSSD